MVNTMQNNGDLTAKKAGYWFLAFCLIHLIIWTLVPTLVYGNPPTDSLEGIAWGNLWQLGYEKHPFLAPWLTAAFTNIFGAVSWPIYFLGQLSVVACFYAIWRLANYFLPPWQALVAVVTLDGISYYNVQAAIFNPNILQLAMWAFIALYFYRAIRNNERLDWILLGVFCGLGMLSKYQTALLIILFFVFLVTTARYRSYLRSKNFYLALLVALLIYLPNFIWLWVHHFDAVRYALGEMGSKKKMTFSPMVEWLYHPVEFILEQAFTLAPTLLLYIPFYKSEQIHLDLDPEQWKFIKYLALGPMIFTILFSLLTNSALVSRWAYPYFSGLGILWLCIFRPQINKAQLKKFAYIWVGYTLLLVVGLAIYFQKMPYYTHKANYSAWFPGNVIAKQVTNTWHDQYHTKLPYIIGDHNVVVNIAAFSKDKPIAFFNESLQQSPWINLTDVKQKGGMIVVWLDKDNPTQRIDYIKQLFPTIQDIQTITFPKLTGAQVQPVHLWIAILPPKTTITK